MHIGHQINTEYKMEDSGKTVQLMTIKQEKDLGIYSVSQKNPPYGFLKFFSKRLGIFKPFLRTYYTILSTLEYKFLFKYLQL